jgi:hypothetical protein
MPGGYPDGNRRETTPIYLKLRADMWDFMGRDVEKSRLSKATGLEGASEVWMKSIREQVDWKLDPAAMTFLRTLTRRARGLADAGTFIVSLPKTGTKMVYEDDEDERATTEDAVKHVSNIERPYSASSIRWPKCLATSMWNAQA